jgi:hypothetical protein
MNYFKFPRYVLYQALEKIRLQLNNVQVGGEFSDKKMSATFNHNLNLNVCLCILKQCKLVKSYNSAVH